MTADKETGPRRIAVLQKGRLAMRRGSNSKLDKPYQICQEKMRIQQIDPYRKSVPHTVTFPTMQQPEVGLP